MVSFGGPKVQHSCAMNTWCIQYSFHNYMLVPEKGWNSGYIHGTLCLCQRRGGYIHVLLAGLSWQKVGGEARPGPGSSKLQLR